MSKQYNHYREIVKCAFLAAPFFFICTTTEIVVVEAFASSNRALFHTTNTRYANRFRIPTTTIKHKSAKTTTSISVTSDVFSNNNASAQRRKWLKYWSSTTLAPSPSGSTTTATTSDYRIGSTLSFTSFRDDDDSSIAPPSVLSLSARRDFNFAEDDANGELLSRKNMSTAGFSLSSRNNGTQMINMTSESSKRVLQILEKAYTVADNIDGSSALDDNYVNRLNWKEVLEIVTNEYSFRDVPFTIGGIISYDPNNSNGGNANSDGGVELFSKLLSYAAINRIPKELTSFLLDACSAEGAIPSDYADAFRAIDGGGWSSVRYPSGLSLRIKRRYLASKRQRFSPVPRRLMNQLQIFEAERSILEASRAKAPAKQISKADILASMDDELSVRSLFSSMTAESERWKESLKKDFEVYFPRQNRALKKFSKFLSAKTEALKSAGRAGLISYGFLNFIWYTFAVVFSWSRLGVVPYAPAPVAVAQNSLSALRYSIRRFSRVLVSVYVGSQITKLARLSLAVAMAPAGDKILKFIEKRLNVGRDRAFGIVTIALFVTCFLVWSLVVIGDAAISSAGTFAM